MITFKRLLNLQDIIEALTSDDLYQSILGVSDITKWFYNPETTIIELVLQNNMVVGIMLLRDESKGYVSFHGGIYKNFKGSKSFYTKFFKKLKKYVYPYHLCTFIPIDNKANQLITKVNWKFKKQVTIKNIKLNYYVE